MKNYLTLLALVLILLPTVNADHNFTLSNNDTAYNTYINYSSFIYSDTNLDLCWFELNYTNSSFTQLSGTSDYCENISLQENPVGYNFSYKVWANDTSGVLNYSTGYYIVSQKIQGLDIRECPDTLSNVLILALLIILSLVFMIIGLNNKLAFIGLFGSLLLMVTSWYISPCLPIYAYILGGFSLIMILWYVFHQK